MPDRCQLLTYADVAVRLNVSKRTVQRLKDAGSLPFVTVGGQVRFHPDDVDRYIASRRTFGKI